MDKSVGTAGVADEEASPKAEGCMTNILGRTLCQRRALTLGHAVRQSLLV